MLLAIDVGNSHTVFGVHDGSVWLATWRHQTDVETTEDELAAWLIQLMTVCGIDAVSITKIACASVVPGMNQILGLLGEKYFGCSVEFLTGNSNHGVKVDYNPPNAVGADRIANAIASLAQYSAPIIVVDFGTATTFDVIDKDSVYVGGAIMAGPITSMQALVAKLSADLIGKSFNVTDDGFLKRIRAAQASGDVTRVVLDVSDVTEYTAFLLPNPYRLIIDIHGKKGREEGIGKRDEKTEAPVEVAPAAATTASAAANVSGLPPMAPTDGGDLVRPIVPSPQPLAVVAAKPAAKPVPNTVAVTKPATTSEVAAVSSSPGKVEATTAPTSKPIVATVPAPRDVALVTRTTRAKPDAAAPTKAADKTADGQTSLIRALGLKINRIVIDAGHGGHDSGTLGADGIEEKDVVLDIALRVGKLLHERLGAEIIYTRSDDTFIPLETRTAIANKAQADLFLSIHANSSQDSSARGVEVYYLNFTSDPTALDVAARENAVSGASVHQLSDLVKKITLKDKISESREFAADVEGSLFSGLTRGNAGLKDRGVKKAPFVVLIGANMPSILAEISFVTNPRDAEQLRQPEYRQRVAESLYAGVAKYENGLAGSKPLAPAVKRASLQ